MFVHINQLGWVGRPQQRPKQQVRQVFEVVSCRALPGTGESVSQEDCLGCSKLRGRVSFKEVSILFENFG